MRKLLFSLLFAGAAALAQQSDSQIVVGGELTDADAYAQRLERQVLQYRQEVAAGGFFDQLRAEPGWRHQLTLALMGRYALEPEAAPISWGAFESELEAAIAMSPTELAPRAVMLAHCHQVQRITPLQCLDQQARALITHHPDNALGYLYRAQWFYDQGDLDQAANFMVQAAEADRISTGLWAAVEVLFDSLAREPVMGVPEGQEELVRLGLAEATVAQMALDPKRSLIYRCQQATEEPLLAGCLALARALKLPGTTVMWHQLGLAVEERIVKVLDDDAGLQRVRMQRGGFKLRHKAVDHVRRSMTGSGIVKPVLAAWVQLGELDTEFDSLATYQANELNPEGTQPQLVLVSSKAERTDCLDTPLSAIESQCVTAEMLAAEIERMYDHAERHMISEDFLQSLAQDESPEANIIHLSVIYMAARTADRTTPPPIEQLIERFPTHPLANRLLLDWCFKMEACLLETGRRMIQHEPEEATGYLVTSIQLMADERFDEAVQVLQASRRANRVRGGYGLLARAMSAVLVNHWGTAPVADPLGVWPVVPYHLAFGYAAAISMPEVSVSRYCDAPAPAMVESCLTAAQLFQLPGRSLMHALVGLSLESGLRAANGDDAALIDVLDREATMELLRDRAARRLDTMLTDPDFLVNYVTQLGARGEIAALQWADKYDR